MSTCPKCKTGMIADNTSRYAIPANKCFNCGTYHEVGASRQSLDRQVTGVEPAHVGSYNE